MSGRGRRMVTASFNTEVVPEALGELMTISELAQQFDLHPDQTTAWKREFLQGAVTVFEAKRSSEQERDRLFQQIGRLEAENDPLKKRRCAEPIGETRLDRPSTPHVKHKRAVRGLGPGAQYASLQA
ncbi:MAG: transposase [Flavobacteriales bacterium]